MKELFDLFTRLVVAAEKLAGNAPLPVAVAEKAEKPKKEPKKAEESKPEPAKESEKKANPFEDDEPAVTKEQVRKVLTDYANATDNDKALSALADCTSNKASKIGEIKPEDYSAVYKSIGKLLADTKK